MRGVVGTEEGAWKMLCNPTRLAHLEKAHMDRDFPQSNYWSQSFGRNLTMFLSSPIHAYLLWIFWRRQVNTGEQQKQRDIYMRKLRLNEFNGILQCIWKCKNESKWGWNHYSWSHMFNVHNFLFSWTCMNISSLTNSPYSTWWKWIFSRWGSDLVTNSSPIRDLKRVVDTRNSITLQRWLMFSYCHSFCMNRFMQKEIKRT